MVCSRIVFRLQKYLGEGLNVVSDKWTYNDRILDSCHVSLISLSNLTLTLVVPEPAKSAIIAESSEQIYFTYITLRPKKEIVCFL